MEQARVLPIMNWKALALHYMLSCAVSKPTQGKSRQKPCFSPLFSCRFHTLSY